MIIEELKINLTTAIAIYGAALSTIVGGVTVANYLRSTNKVKVEVGKGLISDGIGGVSDTQITIRAINKGGEKVTLSSMGFIFPGKRFSLFPTTTPTQLPHELEPGKSIMNVIDIKRYKAKLKQGGINDIPTHAYFTDQIGRVYKGEMKLKHWKDFFED